MDTKENPRPEDRGPHGRPGALDKRQANPQQQYTTDGPRNQARFFQTLEHLLSPGQDRTLDHAIKEAHKLSAVWQLCQDDPETVLRILMNHQSAFQEALEQSAALSEQEDSTAKGLLAEALGRGWSW